jgi:DNA-directed RNA polymerase subunit H
VTPSVRPRSPRPTKRGAPPAAEPAKPVRAFRTHHLIPPHELLSEDETRKVLETIGSPVERLPKILVSDPGLLTDPTFRAAREAGEVIVGRLVRVRRPSPTAGEAIAYRVLVTSAGD